MVVCTFIFYLILMVVSLCFLTGWVIYSEEELERLIQRIKTSGKKGYYISYLGEKKNPHTMKEIQSNHALGIIFPCCDFKFFLRIQSVCIFPQYSVYLRQSKLFKAFCCSVLCQYTKNYSFLENNFF